MELYHLYRVVNTVNQKIYVGITKNPETRRKQHLVWKRNNSLSLLRLAVEKYGGGVFSFEVLCVGDKEYIIEMERRAIEVFDTCTPNGYNIRKGGEDCGSGHKIVHRSDWEPVYVKGFWFPRSRVAKEVLNITDCNFYKWKKNGTLGDVQRLRKNSFEAPVYVGGFWFPTLTRASDSLRVKRRILLSRIYRGAVDEMFRVQDQGKKPDGTYSMTGRSGEKHHNSKAVSVEGVVYGSLAEAGRESGYTRKMISTRINNNTPGFFWV